MKINSNTISLAKESFEFQKIEDVIMKIAAINGIKDVTSVEIQLESDKGFVGFKVAADAIPSQQTPPAQSNQAPTAPVPAGQAPGAPVAPTVPGTAPTTGDPTQKTDQTQPTDQNKQSKQYFEQLVQGLDSGLEELNQQYGQQQNQ